MTDYPNDTVQDVAEKLLSRGYTVDVDPNTQIHVFLRDGTSLGAQEVYPYEIGTVYDLGDESYFGSRVTLDCDWEETNE